VTAASGRVLSSDAGPEAGTVFLRRTNGEFPFSKPDSYMKQKFSSFMLALIIGLVIVAIGMGFLFGPTNPAPWVLMVVLAVILIIYNRKPGRDKLKWKEEYSVGIKQLDDDHKQLILLLNRFLTAYEYHTGEAFERGALKDLSDYTKYHFENEEALMEKHGFPGLDEHKEQHDSMIAVVGQFQKDYELRGHEALQGVANYLYAWLINHINGTDKQYSSFLTGKGVS
jgi:hemerythrin-like metal-binding protein